MNKVWLASFPRSGNTFIRNIFFHVYGIDSLEDEKQLSARGNIQFVKTHMLPFELSNYTRKKDKVIYLVRDGRDSVCSLAHKRKNIIDVTSDLELNFKEAIEAHQGSFFGGWGNNILFWLKEDPILIRFEDLVENPRKVFEEKLEKQLNLPSPNWDELPTFEKQKSGNAHFGNIKRENVENFPNLFFRKGKIGVWKNEMSPKHQQMFVDLYKKYLLALGYGLNGEIETMNQDLLGNIKNDTFSRLAFRFKLKYWYIKESIKSKIKNGF